MITCADCGGEYDPNDEYAEDHGEHCPVRAALEKRGWVKGDNGGSD